MDLIRSRLGIKENVDLKPHTTFGVGGSSKYFAEIGRARETVDVIKFANDSKIPYIILAGGSNSVFADGLLDLLVIKIKAPTLFLSDGAPVKHIEDHIKIEGNEVVADAGVRLMDLITYTIASGLSGLESLSGIPGSVGGALVGNAGAYGQTAGAPVVEVEIFDGENIRTMAKDECQFGYRDSIFKKKPWVVLSVRFALSRGDARDLLAKSREIVETRNKKYSPDIKCPGSFFKNILIENVPSASLKFLPKDRDYYGKVPAWFFLDQVGAKGMVEGGIKIADFHGNLLMNVGGATFKDVTTLSDKLKRLVFDKFGIVLEEEVRYVK